MSAQRAAARPKRAPVEPANDNLPGTITPDDKPSFLALGMICLGVLLLAAYAVMGGLDDVVAMLQR